MSGNNRIRIIYAPYRKEITCEYQREGGEMNERCRLRVENWRRFFNREL